MSSATMTYSICSNYCQNICDVIKQNETKLKKSINQFLKCWKPQQDWMYGSMQRYRHFLCCFKQYNTKEIESYYWLGGCIYKSIPASSDSFCLIKSHICLWKGLGPYRLLIPLLKLKPYVYLPPFSGCAPGECLGRWCRSFLGDDSLCCCDIIPGGILREGAAPIVEGAVENGTGLLLTLMAEEPSAPESNTSHLEIKIWWSGVRGWIVLGTNWTSKAFDFKKGTCQGDPLSLLHSHVFQLGLVSTVLLSTVLSMRQSTFSRLSTSMIHCRQAERERLFVCVKLLL